MINKKIIKRILLYLLLVILSIGVLVPILWMISTSLKTNTEAITNPPKWIPQNITFDSYKKIWTEYNFITYFKNSLITTFISLIVSVAISCLAGYGFTRFKFKGKQSMLSFILITQMFPSVMLLIPYYTLLSNYGLKDSLAGLVLVYISFKIAFCTWTMVGYFKTVPISLDEAAIIDGCSRWKTFYKIVLPMTLPGIAATAIYSFITSWNEYMFANILTVEKSMKTIPVAIAEFNGSYVIKWNDMMAGSVISSIPLLILFIFLQKYFISGLTAGAVKE